MDALKQGIIVWTADGTCAMHNQGVLDVLALDRTLLRRGMPLAAFLGQLVGRGDTDTERQHAFRALYPAGQPFQYD